MKFELAVLLGLDDVAHNRLYTFEHDYYLKVANYGKRNKAVKCYCKEIKKLRSSGNRR